MPKKGTYVQLANRPNIDAKKLLTKLVKRRVNYKGAKEVPTHLDLIMNALIKKAEGGDTKALDIIMSYLFDKPSTAKRATEQQVDTKVISLPS